MSFAYAVGAFREKVNRMENDLKALFMKRHNSQHVEAWQGERGEGFVSALLVAAVFSVACIFLLSLVEPFFEAEGNRSGPFAQVAFEYTGTLPSAGRWQDLLKTQSELRGDSRAAFPSATSVALPWSGRP